MNQSTPAEAVITEEQTSSRHSVWLTLETTQALPMEGSRVPGRMFRIENLHLEYSRVSARTGWHLEVCTASGAVLKASGVPGVQGGRQPFRAFGPDRELTEDCPEWIAELAERYRP